MQGFQRISCEWAFIGAKAQTAAFMRFLGFGLSDRVPDARTIWLFREKLTKAGAIGPLFERFDATLRQTGYIAMSGQIVDASLIAAPRQRNTQDEKKAI